MDETTTARETTTAFGGSFSPGPDGGTAVISAANPDGAPVVPSLRPGTAQQMLAEIETGVITYVLDTSVLLSDPLSLHRFAEHDIVLPIVVVTELEAKRHHPDLGYFARQALRILDDLRELHGNLSVPLPIGKDGGHVHVDAGEVLRHLRAGGERSVPGNAEDRAIDLHCRGGRLRRHRPVDVADRVSAIMLTTDHRAESAVGVVVGDCSVLDGGEAEVAAAGESAQLTADLILLTEDAGDLAHGQLTFSARRTDRVVVGSSGRIEIPRIFTHSSRDDVQPGAVSMRMSSPTS